MAKTEDELPRWAKILIAIVFIGIIIGTIVPGEILYLSIGIAVAVIGGASYLIYRKWGIQPFKRFAEQSYEWLKGGGKTTRVRREPLPQLPSQEAYRLKGAVGNRCESTNCPNPKYPNLDLHHIILRSEERSSHKLSNLLILCPNCHRAANRGMPPREIQKQLATRHGRFSKSHLVRDWKYS